MLAFVGFFARLVYLQVIQHEALSQKSQYQLSKIKHIYPTRGSIYDRNGAPLAVTETAVSIFANPQEISSPNFTARQIAWFIPLNQLALRKKLKRDNTFVWVSRKVSEKTAKKIKALKLDGIHFLSEDKRQYPQGVIGSDVLGFVGIDNQGLAGLEYKFDKPLKGSSGSYIFEGDPRRNRLVTGRRKTVKTGHDGQHLVTTIDRHLQYFAEKYLREQIELEDADKGYVIILEPNTGEVLAMADYPSFDGNDWQKSSYSTLKNGCVSDVYEPGSIFKIFTLAAAIEEEIVKPNDIMDVPEQLPWFGKVIKEGHERSEDETNQKTVTEVLTQSLNVGTTLLASELGERKMFRYIQSFGFGEKTGIGLPGEAKGLFRPLKKWSRLDVATFSFGQGIAVTPLQMAVAASSVVNGGWLVQPKIIRYHLDSRGIQVSGKSQRRKRRVLTAATVDEMKKMLLETVNSGTGQIVKIPGYNLGGKTGTAQKPSIKKRGYEEGVYISSFVGAVPIGDPKAIILVSIDHPKKNYYGSTVAGPVFKKLALRVIDRMNIPPQDPSKLVLQKKSIEKETVENKGGES